MFTAVTTMTKVLQPLEAHFKPTRSLFWNSANTFPPWPLHNLNYVFIIANMTEKVGHTLGTRLDCGACADIFL